MSTIFVSHSSADNALATELLDWLRTQGYRSVFLDLDPDEGIEAGERWEKVLYRATGNWSPAPWFSPWSQRIS